MPAGRPPLPFDQDLADMICEQIATTDFGLEEILEELRITRGDLLTPGITTIYKWLSENKGFAEQSARARELQSHLLFDRAQKQAREPLIGQVVKDSAKDGMTTTTSDNVERSKLLVQTTLRRAGQLNPKKYGEKIQQEHSGQVGVQLIHSIPRPERE